MKDKKKIYKIFNIIEPILLLLTCIGVIYSIFFAFDNVDWVALGGTLRAWYWYESLIMNLTLILPLVIVIFELIMFFKISKRYKLYTVLYVIIDIIVSVIAWNMAPIIFLVSIFVFNLIKSIFRHININKIFKN